ncbi:DMT family transporter [Paenibacillus albiflavus]|uniref:DMT family transporter n=1 Tax=Paenibacillus albiflavus TaxID=2545760 RepID=A0A4R4EHZ6_9BACL|nr:DMT family transporter [Paenibacillus albiflavus]TCZ77808.1 DMT family transporter [Paenibacillus albiflavus]
MNHLFLLLLVLVSGMGVSVQSGVNGELGKRIGTIEGAFTSFLIGLIALTLIMLFTGKGNITDIFVVPKWMLLGGILGAFFVVCNVLAVPKLGVGITVISVIVGQIIMSLVIDHFGWFGRMPVPFNWQRALGAVLLFAALFLIFRSTPSTNSTASNQKPLKENHQYEQSVATATIEESTPSK